MSESLDKLQQSQETLRAGVRQAMEWALSLEDNQRIAELGLAVGALSSSIVTFDAVATGRAEPTELEIPSQTDLWSKRDKHMSSIRPPAEVLQKYMDAPDVLNTLAQFSPRFYDAIDTMVTRWGRSVRPGQIAALIPVPDNSPADAQSKAFRRMIKELRESPLGKDLHDNGVRGPDRIYWFGNLNHTPDDTQPKDKKTAEPLASVITLSHATKLVSVTNEGRLDDENWGQSALCRQVDTEIFFPESRQTKTIRMAKSICAACKVVTPCLESILSETNSLPIDGIVGGLTTSQRELITNHSLDKRALPGVIHQLTKAITASTKGISTTQLSAILQSA